MSEELLESGFRVIKSEYKFFQTEIKCLGQVVDREDVHKSTENLKPMLC